MLHKSRNRFGEVFALACVPTAGVWGARGVFVAILFTVIRIWR